MGKVMVVLLLGAVAGAGFAGYNAVRYEVLQPFPLAWNHLPEEVQLFELEYRQREVVAKLGSAQRIAGLSGMVAGLEGGGQVDDLKAELAVLDAAIRALQTKVQALKGG